MSNQSKSQYIVVPSSWYSGLKMFRFAESDLQLYGSIVKLKANGECTLMTPVDQTSGVDYIKKFVLQLETMPKWASDTIFTTNKNCPDTNGRSQITGQELKVVIKRNMNNKYFNKKGTRAYLPVKIVIKLA